MFFYLLKCKIKVFPWNRNMLNQYHKKTDVIAIKEQDNNKYLTHLEYVCIMRMGLLSYEN